MRGTVLAPLRSVLLFRKVEALLWPHRAPMANHQTDCKVALLAGWISKYSFYSSTSESKRR